ncbi:MAG: glycosyltransferase family 4 protein [Gammaproteobacteria bacterium]
MAEVRLCMVLGGHWAAQMGGAQFQAKCLLELMTARAEFETFYVTHVAPRERFQPGYEIVRFGPGQTSGASGVLSQLPSLYSVLKRLRPDVVYQRCLMPYTGACALYCAGTGARLIFHVASDWDVRKPKFSGWGPRVVLHRLSRWISEYGLRRASAIIVQTHDQARTLKTEYGLDATLVVPNVQPLPPPREPVARSGPRRVIWVGNFKPVKNPELFLDLAAAFAKDGSVRFVMIGRAGDATYAPLHDRIRQMANVDYLGELPVESVDAEIAASDILVNTSSTEGFPNTFIQGWLRGVPAVSCSVDPDGCLSRGGAGIMAGSPARLVTVISELLADEEKLRALSLAAREYGRRNHTLERAQGLIDLLAHRKAGTK